MKKEMLLLRALNDPKRRRYGVALFILLILILMAYFAWTTQRPDLATVYSGNELNGSESGRDLVFQSYDQATPFQVLAAWMTLWPDLLLLLEFTLFFGLIGGGILYLIRPDGKFAGVNDLILASACGLSFFPILIFAMSLLHLRITLWLLVAAVGGLAVLVIVAAVLRNRRHGKQPGPAASDWRKWVSPEGGKTFASALCIAGTGLLALVVRVLQVKDVYVPLWTDGLAHTQDIARILAEGGLPSGVLYHLGFHMNTAVWALFTGVSLPHLTLLMGQWLLAMAGFSFYLVAYQITGRVLPAWLSVIGLWFFSSLPGYLINWGRYPFLLGLVLLPAVVFSILEVFQKGRFRDYVLALILVCGLFLSHYGTISLCASLLFSFGLHSAWKRRQSLRADFFDDWMRFKKRLWLTGAVLLVFALILISRLAPLFQNQQMAVIIQQSLLTAENMNYADVLQLNLSAAGAWVWGAALLGIIIADFLDRRSLAIVGGWVLAQPVLIWLQRPFLGEAVASYNNWLLILSFPASILAGIFVEWLLYQVASSQPDWGAKLPHPLFSGWRPAIAWTGLALALVGFPIQTANINLDTILFGAADQPAMEWIRDHIPASARFLINSNYWGTLRITPSDGGSWLSLMTGCPSLYIEDPTTDLSAFIRDHSVDYVYLGHGTGFLQPEVFSDPVKGFVLVYYHGDVKIYKTP